MKDWQVCLEFFGGKNGKNYIKSFWNLRENVSIPKCMNEILTLHDLLWRKNLFEEKNHHCLNFWKKSLTIFPRGVNLMKIPENYKIEVFQEYVAGIFFFKQISFFSILKNTFIGIYSLFIIIFRHYKDNFCL